MCAPARLELGLGLIERFYAVGSSLGLLALTIGPVLFLVSAQAPLMQRWYALDPGRGEPYALYAASNLGSFAGLIRDTGGALTVIKAGTGTHGMGRNRTGPSGADVDALLAAPALRWVHAHSAGADRASARTRKRPPPDSSSRDRVVCHHDNPPRGPSSSRSSETVRPVSMTSRCSIARRPVDRWISS